MDKICLQCNKSFEKKINYSKTKWSSAKFCSHKCHSEFTQGKPSVSPATTFKKGNRPSPIAIQLNRERIIGENNPRWNGGQVTIVCKICGENFQVDPYREKTANFCSVICSNEFRKSPEFRLKTSELQKKIFEEKLGGFRSRLTTLAMLIRNSIHYKLWRENIFKRDNFTCKECGQKGGALIGDHIKQFGLILIENDVKTFDEALFCVELWDLSNGQTLCLDCHKNTPTYGRRVDYQLVNH